MTNPGIAYEQLTQHVFQQLHRLSGVDNLIVQQDITLPGKTVANGGRRVAHQVDVYWEFELAGILYKTAIQVKDWRSSVPQGEVLKFKEVLDDLPGSPRGIMVTRTGFQKGARDYADAHGIVLYELRPPTQDDLAGRFVKLGLTIRMRSQSVKITGLEADDAWVRQTGFSGTVNFDGINALHERTHSESGEPNRPLSEIFSDYVPKDQEAVAPIEFHHRFTEPTFIRTSTPELPLLKILSLAGLMEFQMLSVSEQYDFSHMLTFMLRTVSRDQTYFVDGDGNVRKG